MCYIWYIFNIYQLAYLFLILFNLEVFWFLKWDFTSFPFCALPSLASPYRLVSMMIFREHLFIPSFDKYTLNYFHVQGNILGLEETPVTGQSCNGCERAYHERSSMKSDKITEEGSVSFRSEECFPRAGDSWPELCTMSRNYPGKKSLDILCAN